MPTKLSITGRFAEKDRPCIAFALSDGPIRLTRSFRQMIGDLIG
ncbi:hypothetical protein [Rhizobium sp. Nf11,1]